MNRYQEDKDQRGYYRESDSYHNPRGRFEGPNRFGEEHIQPDSYQDDQFKNDYDPTYKDEYGIKHPYEHGGKENRWSDDIRSTASRENHFGKGPKGYRRPDLRIYEDACEILTLNHRLDPSEIEVEVFDGCIYLNGEVNTKRDKNLAEELVDGIAGVKDVWNNLKVRDHFDGWQEISELDGPIKGLY